MLLFPIHTFRKGQKGVCSHRHTPKKCVFPPSPAQRTAFSAAGNSVSPGRVSAARSGGADQPSSRFISETTLLSMREICTCETPMTSATSLCVISRK